MQHTIIITDLVTVSLLSAVGGAGSYLQACRSNQLPRTFFNFLTELVLALTVGLSIMYISHWQHWKPGLTNFLILVLANNGADTLARLKSLSSSFLSKYFTPGGSK